MLTCKQCASAFEISQNDLAFLEEVSPVFSGQKELIPSPTLCPDCRQRRRLNWRNERTLYRRTCSSTGKEIISVYAKEKPYKAFDNDEWHSDKWDARSFGRDFDFGRPFFEQFHELFLAVPQLSRSASGNQNSDYTNQCGWCKNCYLIFEADFDEDCLYANYLYDSKKCVDNLQITRCELCYECIDCINCYHLHFSQNCQNCSDSWFLTQCIGCSECVGCVNLRNKRHCIFNEQLSPEEYAARLATFQLRSRSKIFVLHENCSTFAKKFHCKALRGTQNEDSTGDYLWNTQRCVSCFDVQESQDCKHLFNCRRMKKVQDVTVFGSLKGAEFCYENHEIGDGARNIIFCDQAWTDVNNCTYSKLCVNGCHDLFGCIGLKHAQYCVLNKQYTKEEYEQLVPKIIGHMRKTSEWGEFFPVELSPFAYNESVAQEYFPLSKKEVIENGWAWRDSVDDIPNATKIIPGRLLPETINETPDDILQWAIECEVTKRPFKIIKQELDFYRQLSLPVPTLHPDERHRRRMALRNPRRLWTRPCSKCRMEIQTTFAPDREESVLCEACYLKEVY